MSYTKGEWKIVDVSDQSTSKEAFTEAYNLEVWSGGLRTVLARIKDIEMCPEHGGAALDNAQLFAAAPDMVEALEDLIRHNEALNEAFYGQGTATAMRAAMSGQKALLMKARNALTKSKGGQS